VLGNWAPIVATPNVVTKFHLTWSLGLTSETGFIIAFLAGVFVGNFMLGLTKQLKEALRPEMYIKIATIILGTELRVKAVDAMGPGSSVIFLDRCAIVEGYLIFWALVYFVVARKYFKFSREGSVSLASGISICGISAAIATGGAVHARPLVPIMVFLLLLVFICTERLLLPFVAQMGLSGELMVAGSLDGP